MQTVYLLIEHWYEDYETHGSNVLGVYQYHSDAVEAKISLENTENRNDNSEYSIESFEVQ